MRNHQADPKYLIITLQKISDVKDKERFRDCHSGEKVDRKPKYIVDSWTEQRARTLVETFIWMKSE